MIVWQVVMGGILVVAGIGMVWWRKRFAAFNAKLIRDFGGAGAEATARMSTPGWAVASGIGTLFLGGLFIFWALPQSH